MLVHEKGEDDECLEVVIMVISCRGGVDEGPSTPTTTTPQVPVVEGPITRSKARILHKELDKVIIYFTNAIHELANLGEGTRRTFEANLSTVGQEATHPLAATAAQAPAPAAQAATTAPEE